MPPLRRLQRYDCTGNCAHQRRRWQGHSVWDWTTGRKIKKGCDIGYALAADSCEGVNDVEHAPSQPLDAITAFAVPNPNGTSQRHRFFRVWLSSGSLRQTG